jgi:fructose-1,6-bisphosphatase/inositol monophosphatase family enzyme
LGSTALHIAIAARGGAVGALCGSGTHLWDIAGALAVAEGTGLEARSLDGELLDLWSLSGGAAAGKPFLVTEPAMFRELASPWVVL